MDTRQPAESSGRRGRSGLRALAAASFFGGILAVALPGVARPHVVTGGLVAIAAGVVLAVIAGSRGGPR
jgi:hypothetical protein